jgi:hypothetical protein
MTTMHHFYRQFSASPSQDAYLHSLAELAKIGLAHLRKFQFGPGWNAWS